MESFRYEALDAAGRAVSGVVQADTPRQARAQLRAQGLLPSAIDLVRARERARQPWARGISSDELSLVTRQMATLLASGLTMEQSLSALIEEASAPMTREVLGGVKSEVTAGLSLAGALGSYDRSFPDFYRALVHGGEESGALPTVLQHLADYLDARQALKQKTTLALLYPVLVTLVAVSIVTGLLVFVVPQIVQVFQQSRQSLPLLTRALIGLSDFLRAAWPYLAVLIIGDFTALVGDPSGRYATRPTLTAAEVKANAATYQEQAFKILDKNRTELRFNSEWLTPFMKDLLLDTLKRHTVQQVLSREDFKKRIAENSPISLLEVMYPLMQGYDSVAVKADVELGGNDQLTNLLMGRKMQQDAGQEAQVALTVPLLVGLDGEKKMSKSYGNSIGLNDSPNDMFGKTMRVNDALMLDYYTLLTDEDLDAVKAQHPMQAKKALARILVGKYHGDAAGDAALAYFESTFSKKEQPVIAEGDEKSVSQTVLSKIIAEVAGMSGSEARRLVEQGGVQIDGVKVTVDGPVKDKTTFTLKVGKHKFFKIALTPSKA